jgi:hypothetical protein
MKEDNGMGIKDVIKSIISLNALRVAETTSEKDCFLSWMIETQNKTEFAAESILLDLEEVSKYALSNKCSRSPLIQIVEFREMNKIANYLLGDKAFQFKDKRNNNKYSKSIDEYIKYLKDKTSQLVTPPVYKSELDILFADEQFTIFRNALKEDEILSVEQLKKYSILRYLNNRNLYFGQQRIKMVEDIQKLIGIEFESVEDAVYDLQIQQDIEPITEEQAQYRANFNLDEDYRFTKPYKFVLNSQNVVIKSWMDLMIKLCEELIALFPETIKIFTKNPIVQRSDRVYFNNDGSSMSSPKHLSNGIWVETCFSAKATVYICKLLCEKCGINLDDFEIWYKKTKSIPLDQFLNDRENRMHSQSAVFKKSREEKEIDIAHRIEQNLKDTRGIISIDKLSGDIENIKSGTIRRILDSSNWAVKVRDNYIHKNNICDLDGATTVILNALQSMFGKHGGHCTYTMLFIAVRARLEDFFFDNGFDSALEIFDLAAHLFGKEDLDGNHFIFYNSTHIWETEPNYPKSYVGLFIKWARENDGIISREQCKANLEMIGASSIDANFSNTYNACKHFFWQFESYKFVLAEIIYIDVKWKEDLSSRLSELLHGEPFVPLRDINEYWFNSLPHIPTGAYWSPLFLQEVLAYLELEYKTIPAGDGQDFDAVHAAVLPKDSNYTTFGDIVWRIADEELNTPVVDIDTEKLRQALVRRNVLQGTERFWSLHKAIGEDRRFNFSNNNTKVTIFNV